MNDPINEHQNKLAESFQAAFGNEDLLFQIVDLFPIPIEIFDPDGTTLFVNRAFLEVFNISSLDQIIGQYNIVRDPVVNDELGLREYVHRAFQGETLSVSDIKVPFYDMGSRYEIRKEDFDVDALYQDITSFPIWSETKKIAYVVNVFITKRIYQGRLDIAKAREYIENHWQEDFDLDLAAQAANLSRYHFARLFKKHTSMTPYSYYQDIKIKKIKEKLCDKNLSVCQAFADCGVDYNGNHAKIFKEKTGMTPSKYRETVSK